MDKRSQSSVELVIILAVFILVMGALVAVVQKQYTASQNKIRVEKTRYTLNELSKAVDRVYQEGVGAKTKISIEIPSGVKEIKVEDNVIKITLYMQGGESDFAAGASKNVAIINSPEPNNIPEHAGKYTAIVENKEYDGDKYQIIISVP